MLTQLAIYQAGQPARASSAVVNVKPRCLHQWCRQKYQHGTTWEPLVDVRSDAQKSLAKLSYQLDRNSWCLQ